MTARLRLEGESATFAPVSMLFDKHRTRAGSLSVAFTREEDLEAAAAYLPDRPVSPHPNLVTPEGLAELDRALAAARSAYATAQSASDMKADRTAMALAARDLRYYATRRASAQVVQPDTSAGTVVFGAA
jgi:hypothetical protein